MSDLMERIALIAKQNNIEKDSLEKLKSTVKKRKDWDDNMPDTADGKMKMILEMMRKSK